MRRFVQLTAVAVALSFAACAQAQPPKPAEKTWADEHAAVVRQREEVEARNRALMASYAAADQARAEAKAHERAEAAQRAEQEKQERARAEAEAPKPTLREQEVRVARAARCAESRPGRDERLRKYGADFWDRVATYRAWQRDACEFKPNGQTVKVATANGYKLQEDRSLVCTGKAPADPWKKVTDEDRGKLVVDEAMNQVCVDVDAEARAAAQADLQ